MSELYRAIDSLMTAGTGSDIGIRVFVSPLEFELPPPIFSPDDLSATVRSYQETLVRLWQSDSLPEEITAAPTWSAPVPEGEWRNLDPEHLIPLFVRTDESIDGVIYEIQCPGSWWGSCDALERVLAPERLALSARFAADLHTVFPEGAKILHLFESSTSPHENHYFANQVRRTSPDFRYWALDPDAAKDECDLIRAHSYSGLVSEDMFRIRLHQLAVGQVRFDLPPIPIFDQKAAMALPFDPDYKRHFDDAQRAVFPYTALLRDNHVILETGERASINDLLRRPDGERAYMLKYAGLDTTRNWGARGVVALRELLEQDMAPLLETLTQDATRNEPWILQAEVESLGEVTVQEPDGTARIETSNLKINHFLGPTRSLGKLLQASPGRVRWNARTVLSLVREPDDAAR
ncbi:hypothetical protein GCM10027290_29840 [Micromonospora sonneratiae]|uniref:Uncharacterized protein n=1 Tax=Micromonospora sonneratiae TaxID=1184706 RepID=A0ABW3YIG2_9ACTN